VLSATFNNILAISWRSVLLVEETRDPDITTDLSEAISQLVYPIPFSISVRMIVYTFKVS
jgi:hypothetical protein